MTGKTKTKSKAKAIREEAEKVTIMATCGHLPLVSEDVRWINPTTNEKINEVALNFGDSGVLVLDPTRPADKRVLDEFTPWYELGEDPRIEQHNVRVVKGAKYQAPYPAWDTHTVDKCLSRVEEDGYDAEKCLRYELQKDEPREDLIEALEKLVDTPVVEDAKTVPTID